METKTEIKTKSMEYYPDEKSGFEGSVTLMVPTYKARMELIRDKKITAGTDEEAAVAMISIIEEYVEKVDLKHGDHVFKDLDSLNYSEEGTDLMQSMARSILKGVPLGNLSKPVLKGQ